jgi:hypothetical protein
MTGMLNYLLSSKRTVPRTAGFFTLIQASLQGVNIRLSKRNVNWAGARNLSAPSAREVYEQEAGLICNRPVFRIQIARVQVHLQASEQVGISPTASPSCVSRAV